MNLFLRARVERRAVGPIPAFVFLAEQPTHGPGNLHNPIRKILGAQRSATARRTQERWLEESRSTENT
eukprot:2840605-Lingulodinium_polyedra.AAC.1